MLSFTEKHVFLLSINSDILKGSKMLCFQIQSKKAGGERDFCRKAREFMIR